MTIKRIKLDIVRESNDSLAKVGKIRNKRKLRHTTAVILSKIVCAIIFLFSVSFGLYNISKVVNDYYRYDVITNVERIKPNTVTFPAVTICTARHFYKEYSENNTYNETVEYTSEIDLSSFIRVRRNKTSFDFFEIPYFDSTCARFNGAGLSNNTSLKTISNTSDYFEIRINNEYYQNFSESQSAKYSIMNSYFAVFIGDAYFNSYLNTLPLHLTRNNQHCLAIERTEFEMRLGQPYSRCDDSLNETYRQMNCIERCINRGVKNRYNCSIPSYYGVEGLDRCVGTIPKSQSIYADNHVRIQRLTREFYDNCVKECPGECESNRFSLKQIDSVARDGYTRLVFKFPDLSTLRIQQIPKMGQSSLISSIEGSLTLSIGVGLLIVLLTS